MTAYVGILQFTILMRSSHTLKDKRRILRSIKDRLSHRYNISIAEIEDMDVRNHAVMGIALVGNESKYVESVLSKIVEQLRLHPEAELVDHSLEIL